MKPKNLHPTDLERIRLVQRRNLYSKVFSYVEALHVSLFHGLMLMRRTHTAGEE